MPKDLVYDVRIKAPRNLNFGRDIARESATAEESIKDVTKEIQNQIRFLDLQREKGTVTARELTEEYDRLENQLERLPQSFIGTVRAQEKLISAQRRVASGFNATRGSVSGANQALFSFGDIINDAQQFQLSFSAGSRAIGNNIAFLSEQLAGVSNKAGGFRGALKALGSSLIGPGGIIIAINLAVSALTIFGDQLFGTEKAADAAADGVSGFKKELDGLTQALDRQGAFGEDAFNIKALEFQREELERRIDTIQRTVKELNPLNQAQQERIELLRRIRDSELNLTAEQQKELNQLVKLDQVRQNNQPLIDEELKALEQRKSELQSINEELRRQERIQRRAADFPNKGKEAPTVQVPEFTADIGRRTDIFFPFLAPGDQTLKLQIEKKIAQLQKELATERTATGITARGQEISARILGLTGQRNEIIKRQLNDIKQYASQTSNEIANTGKEAANAAQLQANQANATISRISTVAGIAGQAVNTLFGESKAAAIASAIINGAQAITKTFAEYGFTPFGIGAAAAQAAVTAAQVAKIKSTEIGSESGASDSEDSPARSPGIRISGQSTGNRQTRKNLFGQPIGQNNTTTINVVNKIDKEGLSLAVLDGDATLNQRTTEIVSD